MEKFPHFKICTPIFPGQIKKFQGEMTKKTQHTYNKRFVYCTPRFKNNIDI